MISRHLIAWRKLFNPANSATSLPGAKISRNNFSRLTGALVAPVLFFMQLAALNGAQTWQSALARMPIDQHLKELNRTNCVEVMLDALQSNEVVKALVFMPGATDEFYMFSRAKAVLTNSNPTLLDAVVALTNQTFISATFKAPFLLLHTTEDPLKEDNRIRHAPTEQRLRRKWITRLNCNDRDWDFLQPILKRSLKIALRPWRYSSNSWHFYRHSFAAFNVDGIEALEITAFAGKSKFTLQRGEAVFEVDPRVPREIVGGSARR